MAEPAAVLIKFAIKQDGPHPKGIAGGMSSFIAGNRLIARNGLCHKRIPCCQGSRFFYESGTIGQLCYNKGKDGRWG